MGEAKRRRQQPAERTETVIELDEQTNEERRVETIVRDGGSVATFLKKGLNGVPCNGCRMCCYHPRIEVEPQDDIRHLDIETREDGGQTLRRREDGSCVHLGPEGCTVYAHRPRGCRTYDCRLFSLLGIVETAVPVPHWTFSARTQEEKAVLFIAEHYTDTVGATDHVFGLCNLLGFRFAPRIKDLKDRKLYAIEKAGTYQLLEPLIGDTVETAAVVSQWAVLMRLKASIQVGRVMPSVILRKLAAAGAGNALSRALRSLGRIERTLFTLQWLSDPDLRQRSHAHSTP